MDKKALVIYHRVDLDGKSSVFVAYKGLTEIEGFSEDDIKFLGINYGEFDIEDVLKEINSVDRVIIVDFHLDFSEKPKSDVTVIDHHQLKDEIIQQYSEYGIELIHDTSKAAVELTWEYYFQLQQIPKALELLGIYDSWRNDDPQWEDALNFQYFMRSFEINNFPQDFDIFEDIYDLNYVSLAKFIRIGSLVRSYDNISRSDIIRNYGFETNFEGLKSIVCNSSVHGSQLFDSVWDENKFDIMISYVFNPKAKKWEYHLYTTKEDIDVSKIAKKYGGGGHKGASGFVSEKLLFGE